MRPKTFLEATRERTGAVNAYHCAAGHTTGVVLLATVVTPFIVRCPAARITVGAESLKCHVEAQSSFYRVSVRGELRLTHAWYRPSVGKFWTLDEEMQQWVLEGHGLLAPIREALDSLLTPDEFDGVKTYDEALAYLKKTYTER